MGVKWCIWVSEHFSIIHNDPKLCEIDINFHTSVCSYDTMWEVFEVWYSFHLYQQMGAQGWFSKLEVPIWPCSQQWGIAPSNSSLQSRIFNYIPIIYHNTQRINWCQICFSMHRKYGRRTEIANRLEAKLTHLLHDKMAAISLTVFSDAFPWMKLLYCD